MKKILVIDGNSIINRAFYGVRPLSTKSGKPTNAIFGMVSIISKQLDAVKPDYAAVAFDLKAPTFRHEMYEHYKEGRHPTPPDLLAQFDDAKEVLGLMGIHVLELEGYEADDIQGTIAKMAHGCEDTESYVLSGDRDLLQLIDDKVTVLLATNQDTLVMRKEEFRAKYGVDPTQFVDMKALMGDSSDNIPGVAGVGEKTAQALIQSFGSLDGVYECIEDKRITKGVREKLIRDKDNAYLSRKLAEIFTQVPIIKSLDEILYTGPDKAGLYKKFTELELNAFIAKFGLKDIKPENRPHEEANCGCADSEFNSQNYENIPADELKNIIKNRFSLEFLNGKVYIFTNNIAVCYEGELKEICDIFAKKEIICYDAKSICSCSLLSLIRAFYP